MACWIPLLTTLGLVVAASAAAQPALAPSPATGTFDAVAFAAQNRGTTTGGIAEAIAAAEAAGGGEVVLPPGSTTLDVDGVHCEATSCATFDSRVDTIDVVQTGTAKDEARVVCATCDWNSVGVGAGDVIAFCKDACSDRFDDCDHCTQSSGKPDSFCDYDGITPYEPGGAGSCGDPNAFGFVQTNPEWHNNTPFVVKGLATTSTRNDTLVVHDPNDRLVDMATPVRNLEFSYGTPPLKITSDGILLRGHGYGSELTPQKGGSILEVTDFIGGAAIMVDAEDITLRDFAIFFDTEHDTGNVLRTVLLMGGVPADDGTPWGHSNVQNIRIGSDKNANRGILLLTRNFISTLYSGMHLSDGYEAIRAGGFGGALNFHDVHIGGNNRIGIHFKGGEGGPLGHVVFAQGTIESSDFASMGLVIDDLADVHAKFIGNHFETFRFCILNDGNNGLLTVGNWYADQCPVAIRRSRPLFPGRNPDISIGESFLLNEIAYDVEKIRLLHPTLSPRCRGGRVTSAGTDYDTWCHGSR